MSVQGRNLGGEKVGQIAQLDPLGRASVACLRRWSLPGQSLQDHLARSFDPINAHKVADRFDQLAQFLNRYGRRPFMRHGPDCDCLGADEALFAHLCRLAVEGEREDTLMFAMLMCRADMAPCLVTLVEAFALSLTRGALQGKTAPDPTHTYNHTHMH